MRFAVIYRPKHPAPPELLPELLKGMGAWMQNNAGRVENVQFFIDGGGFGTIETDDPSEISRILAEHPFTQYSDVEVKPLIDPASAMSVLVEAYS
jgi:uncharacterized protein DUF3303